MWLYLVAGILVVLGLIGTAVGGGAFTIVLIPVGVLIAVVAIGLAMWNRASEGAAGASTEAHPSQNEPLPHSPPPAGAHAPTSPEALADARRTQQ